MRRRSLIKAIAAGSLTAATPLACLLARNAMAQTEKAPIRTIFLFHPNGCVADRFFPAPGNLTSATNFPAMTRPLQECASNLLFMDGIGYHGSPETHEGGAIKCLTGRVSRDDRRSSIDILMGKEDEQNKQATQVRFGNVLMGVGTHEGDFKERQISYDGGSAKISPCDPRFVYNQLFGGADQGDSSIETKMLSAARHDLERLRLAMGNVDGQRQRLDLHAEALSKLEQLFPREGLAACSTKFQLDGVPGVNPGVPMNDTWAWTKTENLGPASELQQAIAIAALSCGLTRTITFSYGIAVSNAVVPGTNIRDHDASHGKPDEHTSTKVWWMQQVAMLIKNLAATPDVNGSLLDNTIIVGVSDLGNGNNHDHIRVPMFLASGVNNNVGLQVGRALEWRASPYRREGDAGGNDTSFVRHTDVLDIVRQKAGYTSFTMPYTQPSIITPMMAELTGSSKPA